ncbi:MAG: hypothetical protein MRY83_03310 [Flavobacteriales bacterium]|nr:hypothetical protein [Flavobacteriales bacterium]
MLFGEAAYSCNGRSCFLKKEHIERYDKAAYNIQRNPESVLKVIDQIAQESIQDTNKKGAIYCDILKAYIYRVSSIHNIDSNLFFLRRAIDESKAINENALLAGGYSDMAVSFLELNQYDSAFYYTSEAREISRQHDLHQTFIQVTQDLAHLFVMADRPRVAIDLLYDIENRFKSDPDQYRHQRMTTKLSLCKLLLKIDSLSEVEMLIGQMTEYFPTVKNKFWTYHLDYVNAKWLAKKGKYEESLSLIDVAIKGRMNSNHFRDLYDFGQIKLNLLLELDRINETQREILYYEDFFKKHKFIKGLALMEFYKCKVYLSLGDTAAYVELAEQILDKKYDVELFDQRFDFYKTRVEVLEKLGEPVDLAKKTYLNAVEEDEQHKRSMRLSIEDVQSILKQKEKLINQSQKEKEKSRSWLYISIICLAILSLSLWMLYRKFLRSKILHQRDKTALKKQILSLKKVSVNYIKTLQDIENQKENDLEEAIPELTHSALEGNWVNLITRFKMNHSNFLTSLEKVAGRSLSKTEERLSILMKLKLSDKEMMDIMNISPAGLKKAKHRLRARLNLAPDQRLKEFIQER